MFGYISGPGIIIGLMIVAGGLLYNYVYDPFGLSERNKATPPKLDNKSGMSPWAWTQRINAEPVSKGAFILQVEDKRSSKTAVGVPMVEQRWRHPTYDEAAKIIERFHRWQDQQPNQTPTPPA